MFHLLMITQSYLMPLLLSLYILYLHCYNFLFHYLIVLSLLFLLFFLLLLIHYFLFLLVRYFHLLRILLNYYLLYFPLSVLFLSYYILNFLLSLQVQYFLLLVILLHLCFLLPLHIRLCLFDNIPYILLHLHILGFHLNYMFLQFLHILL